MRHRPEERATGGHPNHREVTQAHHATDEAAVEKAAVDKAAVDKAAVDEAAVDEAAVDDAVEMTFPASDPPAWMSSGSRDATPRDPNDSVAGG
jgi:hypothetical protein